jgi:hypothetical protein
VRCVQRRRPELAQTGPRHPVVSRFEFPLATLSGHPAHEIEAPASQGISRNGDVTLAGVSR